MSQALSGGIFPASSLLDTIKSQLKLPRLADTDRTLNVGSLVAGGFDKLRYIPVSTAVQQCQGLARTRVENTINRKVMKTIIEDMITCFFSLQVEEGGRVPGGRGEPGCGG